MDAIRSVRSVTFVNAIRVSSLAILACAASLVVTLSACGAAKETPSASTSSSPVSDVLTPPSFAETATGDNACPSAAPANASAPQWTLPGAHGIDCAADPGERTVQRDRDPGAYAAAR
jgi:hypothetical protein